MDRFQVKPRDEGNNHRVSDIGHRRSTQSKSVQVADNPQSTRTEKIVADFPKHGRRVLRKMSRQVQSSNKRMRSQDESQATVEASERADVDETKRPSRAKSKRAPYNISEDRIIRIKHKRERKRDLTVEAIKIGGNATNVKDRTVLREGLHKDLIRGVPRQVSYKRQSKQKGKEASSVSRSLGNMRTRKHSPT